LKESDKGVEFRHCDFDYPQKDIMTNTTINQGLPFNLDDLVNLRAIEGNRVEFKATWDEYIKPAVVRTVCAFANDLLNLNGGYIILGIEEHQGRPILPPHGLDNLDLDLVQKKIYEACYRIQPVFQPVLFPAWYQGKSILVIWVPGSDNRPHQAPEDVTRQGSSLKYYIRQGPQSVEAKGEFLHQLMEAAAKIPFDDRKNLSARLEDLSPTLVRRFLHDIRSDLVLSGQSIDDLELYRRLRIVSVVNTHEVPKNVGLLFFNEEPDRFFSGARIEVVEFGDDAGGNLIEERGFRGPLPQQIRTALQYLDSLGGTLLQKVERRAEVERTVAYPYEAMEEAIVNAVYHRGYDAPPDPVKVYLYPDRMEIISYPGPPAGIKREDLTPGKTIPPVPARNRRIGDLLKELRLAEGRGTGIPKIQRKMQENGSPEARFDFDDERTYFRAILPVHPRYQALHALREAGHLWAIGDKEQAVAHLQRVFEKQASSGAIASQIIEYAFGLNNLDMARTALARFEKEVVRSEASQPYLTMARLLMDRDLINEASDILQRIPQVRTARENTEAAILKKRAGDLEGAHRLFAEAYAINPNDPQIIQEFAQTKIRLAKNLYGRRDSSVKKRLSREAAELLRKAIHLSDDQVRKAWCWYDLAKVLNWLREPTSEVEAAFLQAQALLPGEPRFKSAYEEWKRNADGKRRR
jgi:ATP-dependent DNA helicase RecG